MPPPRAVPLGTPKTALPWETVVMNVGSMFDMNDSPEMSTIVSAGFSACRSEPELYQKMSSISPVARRVLTMLSPSVPPGRVSMLIVTFGWSAVYASTRACAVSLVFWLSSTR